jgi:HlyD family secretion protein
MARGLLYILQSIKTIAMIRDTSHSDTQIAAPKTHARLKLWIGIAFGVATVMALGAWVVRGGTPSYNIERVRIGEVVRGNLVRDAQVNGRTIAALSSTLSAPASGVIALKVRAGDAVKTGDLLAVLDSPELKNSFDREMATLLQLKADVARERIQAQKQKLLAQRTSDEAQLALTSANRDQQRVMKACDLGVIARVECLKAQDSVDAAKIRSRHANADAGLETQSVGYELDSRIQQMQRQQAVVNDLQRRVEELNLRAPIAGLVGSVAVIDRAKVTENASLITVVDLSKLEVELEIPEIYADDLGMGMQADVNIGAALVKGSITSISPEVINRQVLARVRFDKQPEGLRQNQRVNARVLIENKADVVMVPRGPFFEQLGGRYVYVLKDGIAQKRLVQLGASSIDSIEVIQGLQIGEKIVVSGTDLFENAAVVRIK